LVRSGAVRSAHDCSEGGLAVTLAESCIQGGVGFEGDAEALEQLSRVADGRTDLSLFGEGQARIVISCAAERLPGILKEAEVAEVPVLRIGTVAGRRVRWGDRLDVGLDELGEAWNHGFTRWFN
jgi:phosphoribosylformylglycinamidine synthase